MKNQKTDRDLAPFREAVTEAILIFFQLQRSTLLNPFAYKELAGYGFTKSQVHQAIDTLCADQLLKVEPCAEGCLSVACLSQPE